MPIEPGQVDLGGYVYVCHRNVTGAVVRLTAQVKKINWKRGYYCVGVESGAAYWPAGEAFGYWLDPTDGPEAGLWMEAIEPVPTLEPCS